jgi:hypothetical protein
MNAAARDGVVISNCGNTRFSVSAHASGSLHRGSVFFNNWLVTVIMMRPFRYGRRFGDVRAAPEIGLVVERVYLPK